MSSKEKMVVAIVIVAVLFLGAATYLGIKVSKHIAEKKALAQLEVDNPVEYFVLHTPMTKSEDELKNEMTGTWQLKGAKSRRTGDFVYLQPLGNYYYKTFTLTNWAIATYDSNSNLLYSAGGPYTLQGEHYTESIEAATGQMTQYLHARPTFRIRLDGDKYYQMGAGKSPSIEEMWQRVDQ